jgi:hypothetical protein
MWSLLLDAPDFGFLCAGSVNLFYAMKHEDVGVWARIAPMNGTGIGE